VPILVDCDPATLNIDYADASRKLEAARAGTLHAFGPLDVVGLIPVHVGGLMVDVEETRSFADRHHLWVVEDAAHAFPAAWRKDASSPWVRCGEQTSRVACYSFYANKTITTGEGGMAVTDDEALADRMRLMSLHGLSRDAWDRYRGGASWDYRIVDSGFKYNLTDVAAAIGIHQLAQAEAMRVNRESLASEYRYRLEEVEAIEVPRAHEHRIHSWHLFPIRLKLDRLNIDRDAFITALNERQIGTSVHWRPLHLHPYYERFGWTASDCPVASREWVRLISLPLFPSMSSEEQRAVIEAVGEIAVGGRRTVDG
jgi:perosamine synthetase